MSIRHALWLAVVVSLFLTSCGPYETETETAPAEPAPAAGPDPTMVDAAHYTAEFENDRVRVLRIEYGPGEESVMHYHPQAVAVFLTEAHVEMGLPDGSTVPMHSGAGQHQFHPAGQHRPKNVGEQPIEVVLVELKSGAAGSGVADDQDATSLDPGHYTAEFENDRVRIVRIRYGAGEQSVLHHHPDSVAVFLTDHHVQMTMPDGSTTEVRAAAGEQMFIPAGQHLPKNVSDQSWELILVELK